MAGYVSMLWPQDEEISKNVSGILKFKKMFCCSISIVPRQILSSLGSKLSLYHAAEASGLLKLSDAPCMITLGARIF